MNKWYLFVGICGIVFLLALYSTGYYPELTTFAHADISADWAYPGAYFTVHRPGDKFGTVTECSVGYPATDAEQNHYFITAGHCFRSDDGDHLTDSHGHGLVVYDYFGHPVGYEYMSTQLNGISYVDVSLVKMYPGAKFVTGNFQGAGFSHIPDKIYANPQSNDIACMVGLNHKRPLCGYILEIDAVESMTGYPWRIQVDRASYCGIPGDSGGAVYDANGALGIHIMTLEARNVKGHTTPCSSGFIPITDALNMFRGAIPSLTI